MKLLITALLSVQAFGIVAAFSSSNEAQVGFASFASKFPRSNSMEGLTVGATTTTGYLQAKSYFNSDNCSSEVYAIEYVQLGVCGNYNANYSDPNAVPLSCGKYVSASAYASTHNGAATLNLNYTFFTDSSCTTSGTGSGCTQSVSIQSECYVSTYSGISSSAVGSLTATVDIPSVGYHAMTHLTSTCSDQPYSGLWQRTGCIKLSATDSAHAYCTDSAYKYYEYTSSTSCGGTAAFHTSTPLHMCDQNVFNGDEASAVEYGIGYSMTSCSSTEPTVEPSAEPTAEPSTEPTIPPTASSAPNTTPTATPTARSTVKPTAQPSGATNAPTKQNSPVVTFTSTVTISGLASATLDTDSQNAVVTTTAAAMNIDASHVVYVSASAAVSFATVVDVEEEEGVDSALESVHELQHDASRLNSMDVNALYVQKKKTVLAYTVNAVTQTSISLASTTYTSTDDLYAGLTQSLSDSVTGGSYSDMLRNSGANDLAAADATGVTSSPAQVTSPSSSSKNSGLSDGAIAGIVIGAVAFVVLLGLLYYFVSAKGGSSGGSHRSGRGGNSHEYGYQKDNEMVAQRSPLRGHSAV